MPAVPVRTAAEANALLLEVVDYFKADPPGRRSVNLDEDEEDGTQCAYYSDSRRKCAIGRYLLKPKKIQSRFGGLPIEDLPQEGLKKPIDEIFKPRYRGFPLKLWVRLQNLHDTADYWRDEGGMTEAGLARVEQIKRWILRCPDLIQEAIAA
jgi:hypothetical protein